MEADAAGAEAAFRGVVVEAFRVVVMAAAVIAAAAVVTSREGAMAAGVTLEAG